MNRCYLLALVVWCTPAIAQDRMLIVSQPDPAAEQRKDSSVDISPFVARELREAGKIEPVIYKPALTAIKEALDAKSLTAADLNEPLTVEAMRKVAAALNMRYVLRVSGWLAKDGVAASAHMESRIGQSAWSVVFIQNMDPFHARGKKSQLLEGINAHVATIVQRITGGSGVIPVTAPIEIAVPAAGKGKGKKPDLKNQAARAAGPGTNPVNPIPNPKTTAPAEPQLPARQPDLPVAPKPNDRQAEPAVSANEVLVDKFRRSGDSANLILTLRRAVTDKPRNARFRSELIQTYLDRGWTSAARDEAARAVGLAPNDAGLHRLLGSALAGTGEAEQAVKEYQEAVRLDDKQVANHLALGDGYWNAAQPEEALKAFEAAARADPKSPVPHRRLSKLHAQRGHFKEAGAELNAARELTAPEDLPEFVVDYAAVISLAENALTDVLAKIHATRQAVNTGAKNREQAFTDCTAQKKRVDEIGGMLESLTAPPGFQRIQDLYAQAANLVGQAAEATLQFVETQDSNRGDEVTLLRAEATKQLADAGKRLKGALTPAPTK